MLAAMGYAPGHHTDDTTGGDTAYYNARAEIDTTGMNTNAVAFEPTGRGDDYIEDDGDGEEDATMLVAQHEDRGTSFIVDSEAQTHNLQDIEASGLERLKASATGYIVSSPIGATGSPRALVGGGGKRHNDGHVGPFKAAAEDGQSVVIQNMANARGFESNILSVTLLGKHGESAELGPNLKIRAYARAAPRSRSTRGTGYFTPTYSVQRRTPPPKNTLPGEQPGPTGTPTGIGKDTTPLPATHDCVPFPSS